MPTVLVVDDSPVDLRLVRGILEKDSSLTVQCSPSGAEALQRMHESRPELVLTDMQMPDMNGLELVVTTRLQYPDVPVVLMTAHGSESLAVEALEQGAASYVPKSRLAEKLLDTVDDVLTCTRAQQKNQQLISCMTRAQLTFELDNDIALIDPLVETIQETVSGMGLCDFNGRVRLGVALKEALLNAIFRGNLEWDRDEVRNVRERLQPGKQPDRLKERASDPRYRGRKVYVDAKITRQEAVFVIGDDGPGFDLSTVPDPRDPGSLDTERGRGLWLIKSFMDEIRFNPRGNEITLVKRRQEPAA